VNPCADCAYSPSGPLRVVQFGYFGEVPTEALKAHPFNGGGGGVPPGARYFMTGFRCARPPR
jgi:hypothetical protein